MLIKYDAFSGMGDSPCHHLPVITGCHVKESMFDLVTLGKLVFHYVAVILEEVNVSQVATFFPKIDGLVALVVADAVDHC